MDIEDREHFKTIASPLAPLLDGLQKPRSEANSPSGLDPAYCLTRTRLLFSSYRRDEAHDPEIYCAAIAATLGDFPRQVVEYVTDPRTGLPSTSKFLPNVAEVRSACVNETARLQLGARPKVVFSRYVLPDKPAGDLFVRYDRPRYAEMNEMLSKNPDQGRREKDGIWIPHQWYERREVKPDDEQARMIASQHYFRESCLAEGIDPSRGVSPSLLKTLGEKNEF